MRPIISSHNDEIAALCHRFGVRQLDVFGSAARDDFDPARGDVDLLVEFEPDPSLNLFNAYFDLMEALEDLFGRNLDLVMPDAVVNPYIRASFERDRRTVFECTAEEYTAGATR
jgi:predicted nucleotidyltransferase